MDMPNDLEISRQATLWPPDEIGARMGIGGEWLEPYGRHVAKVDLEAIDELAGSAGRAKYVVVTAVTPTPLGEGKTTTTVGLGDALNQLGHSAVVSLRQPSMGPTFGIKGGAAGGGYAQVVPMEAVNLHMTGDMHAVTAAHNQIAAMADNHAYRRREPRLDPDQISWRRVLDVNDRGLRHIASGLGRRVDGPTRQTGFDITAASEVMACLGLADSLADLRARLGRIQVGTTPDAKPVTAEDINAAGPAAVLLREAIKPNLLQTFEHTPAVVHTGPFGNIAHGNASVVADHLGSHAGEYVVTEAGFGADMGAERFFNIKCRASGMTPDAAVLVATVRACKAHSGRFAISAGKALPNELFEEDPNAVALGAANLRKQLDNVAAHGVPAVVAINAFPGDYASEHAAIAEVAEDAGATAAVCRHHTEGGKGALDLATAVTAASEGENDFAYLYPDGASLADKIDTVARRIYGADGVDFSKQAAADLEACRRAGLAEAPVCIAKTHLSLSADASLKGAPTGWRLPVREIRAAAGAGFVYPICGDITTMPGLSSQPAAEGIDLDANGDVVGLS
jgi:formate--tetrahydrofolate ligase